MEWNATYGFIGLFIVAPALRGQGIGAILWQKAEERLTGHAIGLDAVLDEVDRYERAGFKPAHETRRFEGVVKQVGLNAGPVLHRDPPPIAFVEDLNSNFEVAPRSSFLRAWTAPRPDTRFAWIDDDDERGLAVARQSLDVWRVGPVYANSGELAERLVRAAVSEDVERAVVLHSPGPNIGAAAAWHDLGLKGSGRNIRMYRSTARLVPPAWPHAIAGPELG